MGPAAPGVRENRPPRDEGRRTHPGPRRRCVRNRLNGAISGHPPAPGVVNATTDHDTFRTWVAELMRLDPATASPSDVAGYLNSSPAPWRRRPTGGICCTFLEYSPMVGCETRDDGGPTGEPCDIGDRSDVQALQGAHGDLLLFLTDRDSDPQRGVWRSQLQRLAERYVNAISEVRDAGMAVEVAGGDTTRDGLRVFISGAAG